jgi:protein ImuB
VEAVAPIPDDPPVMFRWRGRAHRVARADGPERIGPEWWTGDTFEPRDYYRVETTDGHRLWLYRSGLHTPTHEARWYVHGFFC